MEKATQEQVKTHNQRLILKTIYDHGEISRADIARIINLTETTISSAVTYLLKVGLISQSGARLRMVGKPPISLSVVDDSRHLIGIDLASREFRGALINLRGQIKYRHIIPISNQRGFTALKSVYELLDNLIGAAQRSILGIGIGTPGLIDGHEGVIIHAINLDWQDLPLRKLIQERYNLPVYMANDCQTAALGEQAFGANKNISNLIVIKIGNGIGSGIVINSQLYHGDGFGAGEIGHTKVVEDGEFCRCGNYGCLETIVSEPALVRFVQEVAINNIKSPLFQFANRPNEIDIQTVLELAQAGDKVILGKIREMGELVGKTASFLAGGLNIQKIIIAGSLSHFKEAFIKPIQERIAHGTFPELARDVRVEISSLGEDIVTVGAAALLLSNELGLP